MGAGKEVFGVGGGTHDSLRSSEGRLDADRVQCGSGGRIYGGVLFR